MRLGWVVQVGKLQRTMLWCKSATRVEIISSLLCRPTLSTSEEAEADRGPVSHIQSSAWCGWSPMMEVEGLRGWTPNNPIFRSTLPVDIEGTRCLKLVKQHFSKIPCRHPSAKDPTGSWKIARQKLQRPLHVATVMHKGPVCSIFHELWY